jgi:hypothetical protein
MLQKIKSVIVDIGELRIMLIVMAIISISQVPFTTNDEVRLEGWGLFPDILAPVLAVILFFVLCLDMLMSRVYMSSLDEDGKGRFRAIIRAELLTLIVMVGVWVPYFQRMLS